MSYKHKNPSKLVENLQTIKKPSEALFDVMPKSLILRKKGQKVRDWGALKEYAEIYSWLTIKVKNFVRFEEDK